MRTIKGSTSSWAAAVGVVLVCLAAVGLAHATAEEKPMDGPIQIEIALDKKEYPFRGAIALTITYTNTSKDTVVMLANGLAPGDGFPGETFEITCGSDLKKYTIVAVDPATQCIKIEPGKSWKRTIKELAVELSSGAIHIDGRMLEGTDPLPDPFGRLDDYTLRLRYAPTIQKQPKPAFGGEAVSNTVKMKVLWR